MNYKRIEKKPQGGGGGVLSPGKLRSMLLGAEKKRKDGDVVNVNVVHDDGDIKLRSQFSDTYDSGRSFDACRDVNVVTVLHECSTSATTQSFESDMISDRRLKDNLSVISRTRSSEDNYTDYDIGHNGMSVSSATVFEFQKAERAPQRVPLAAFSKPAPSKWDDAQKWIASPTSIRPMGQAQVQGGSGAGQRKPGYLSYGRQQSVKVVVEVPDQGPVALEKPDTKQIDSNQIICKDQGQNFVDWETGPYPVSDSYGKPLVMIKNTVGESAISLSRHGSSVSVHSATTFVPPPSTARSVSMRDMGTEMTPMASQEPSRTGTPVRATTPMLSPTSSKPSSPDRNIPASSPVEPHNEQMDSNQHELSEKELQIKTRREILLLGTQLGKMNIAAWASKEEDKDASSSLKIKASERERASKNVIETRATAWEEAEKAKYFARFKREEIKIQTWENHQKAKTESDMRKIEVEVEQIRGRAHDKLMNKLAAARHKAEEKRTKAEAKRNKQAAKTEKQVEFIKKTGRVPSSFCCFRCCH